MSQTSRGTNRGPRRQANLVTAVGNKQQTGQNRPGGVAQSGSVIINNFMSVNSQLNNSRLGQQQQQQQLFSSNIGTNGQPINVSGSSRVGSGSNRLATLANVSVAAAAAAGTVNNSYRNHHLPMANAPTSLANLAHLGGITLLPMSGANEGTGNLSNLAIELDSYNQPQLEASQIRNKIYPITKSNAQKSITLSPANDNSKSNRSAFIAHQQRQVQRQPNMMTNHDLDAVPSVRLLNQVSNMDAANLWILTGTVGDNNAFTGARNRPNVSTLPASTTTLTTVNNSCKPKKNRQTNPIPNQPVFNTNQSFAPASGSSSQANFSASLNSFAQRQHHNSDSGSNIHLHNNSQMPSESIEDDLELNNNSLMKLMAILNNPALTITAVDNHQPSPGVDASSIPIVDRLESSSQIPTLSLNLLNKQHSRSIGQNESIQINEQSSTQVQCQNKTRMPRSAANLQLLFKSNSQPSHNQSQPHNTNAQQHFNTFDQYPPSNNVTKSNDFQLSWSNNKPVTSHLNGSFTGQPKSKVAQREVKTQFKAVPSVINEDATYHHSANEINSRPDQQPTVSVQLLRHIANQAQDDESEWMIAHDPDAVGRAALEPECIITNVRSLLPFSKEAKYAEVNPEVVVTRTRKRKPKTVLTTSRKRLCVVSKHDELVGNTDDCEEDPLVGVQVRIIKSLDKEERHISEQHQILSSMAAGSACDRFSARTGAIPEPDDIFINRPKKIMSKIDTMLEKKKRKRFERISGRSAPKTISLEEQCEESEAEWSDDEKEVLEDLSLLSVRLPLDDEELTLEKSNYIHSLGLVSRYERQKLSINHLEQQMSYVTPLALEEPVEVSEDIKRMVETVLKTDGTDIQMRVDSNIKRNDLPLIEGLSRNTSRVKMSYMNILGLEKRSKRTTLYKLKNADNPTSYPSTKQHQDLRNQDTTPKLDQRAPIYGLYLHKPMSNNSSRANGSSRNQKHEQTQRQSDPTHWAPFQQHQKLQLYLNCRDIVKPSKNEYMKSLGLMAS